LSKSSRLIFVKFIIRKITIFSQNQSTDLLLNWFYFKRREKNLKNVLFQMFQIGPIDKQNVFPSGLDTFDENSNKYSFVLSFLFYFIAH